MWSDTNELHAAERDEDRSARRGLSEMRRVQACGHSVVRRGVCFDCGETFD
ncbi:hypothetical protein AB0K45_09660 [Micrococcus luteus]|uniref:hypothetical protein n=1 Tax=Micrococcus luteus TaxID=1270 RepID=UPI003438D921